MGTLTDQEDRMIKLHNFPKWWLPDVIEFVEEIPKTSLGNFKKSLLGDPLAQKALAGG